MVEVMYLGMGDLPESESAVLIQWRRPCPFVESASAHIRLREDVYDIL
jgi:hypothetical protein